MPGPPPERAPARTRTRPEEEHRGWKFLVLFLATYIVLDKTRALESTALPFRRASPSAREELAYWLEVMPWSWHTASSAALGADRARADEEPATRRSSLASLREVLGV